MRVSSFAVLLLAAALGCFAGLIEVDEKNFDDVVLNSGKYTLVDFYATWCSHCKKLMPTIERLAEYFDPNGNIQIVKCDGDENRKISKRYEIEGYPTLKFFDPNDINNPIEYPGARRLGPLKAFIDDHTNTGTTRKSPVVLSVTPATAPLLAGRKLVLAVTSPDDLPLKRVFEDAARAFRDDDVVFGEINVADHEELAAQFGVAQQETPVVVFVDADGERKRFDGSCDTTEIVAFVNQSAGLFRTPSGGLTTEAGRISEVEDGVRRLLTAPSEGLANDLLAALKGREDLSATYYRKLIAKVMKGESEFLEREKSRLQKVLRSKLAPQAKESLQIRLNILRSLTE